MLNNLATILSPQPLTKTLPETKALVKGVVDTGNPMVDQLNQINSHHLSVDYAHFQTLQTTPADSGDLSGRQEGWECKQREFFVESTDNLAKIRDTTKQATFTWTKNDWSTFRATQRAEGKEVPNYQENLLGRDELEELDAVFNKVYSPSDKLLSTSPEAIQRAKGYRDEVVFLLQGLQKKHEAGPNSTATVPWVASPQKAYLVLSPLPGNPIPLPLPTESAQKMLYHELQQYATSISAVSSFFHLDCGSRNALFVHNFVQVAHQAPPRFRGSLNPSSYS